MIKKLLNSKFKKDLSFNYFTQGISIGFGFLQLFLINRYFGVEVFGQLAIIMSTSGILSALLTARSSEAITRFFTREILNSNLENAKFILSIGFIIDLITALLLVVLVYIFSDFIAQTFIKNLKFNNEVFLYSFVVFFGFLRGTLFGYFQSKEMFFHINSIAVFESFLKIIFFLFVIFVLQETTLHEIILTLIVSSIITFICAFSLFLKEYKVQFQNIQYIYNRKVLKEYWGFNLKTFTSSSLKVSATNIDNLILGYYVNTEVVGTYQTIKKLLSPISFLIAPFSTLTLTKIVKYYENREFELMHTMIKNTTFKLVALSVLIVLLLSSILKYFLIIQGINYTTDILLSFLLLSVFYLLPTFIWWGRNFIIIHNPSIPIYSNLLLSINSIWIPIALYQLDYFSGLVTICLGVLLAYIPSWLFAPIIYIKFMKRVI
jgi:O-antigen/teichoic acid export membrane protein